MVVDDDPTFVLWLSKWLSAQSTIRFLGAGPSLAAAREGLPLLRPDVLLIDYKMPGDDVPRFIRELGTAFPATRVVLHTGYLDTHAIQRALTAGAAGVIGKDVGPDELLELILRAAKGDTVFSQSARRVIMELGSSLPAERRPPG
jgi:DNA-binding NarL/FixJ family response regulator